jgi:hypothetical protein
MEGSVGLRSSKRGSSKLILGELQVWVFVVAVVSGSVIEWEEGEGEGRKVLRVVVVRRRRV